MGLQRGINNGVLDMVTFGWVETSNVKRQMVSAGFSNSPIDWTDSPTRRWRISSLSGGRSCFNERSSFSRESIRWVRVGLAMVELSFWIIVRSRQVIKLYEKRRSQNKTDREEI